jgi:hypothetical protein
VFLSAVLAHEFSLSRSPDCVSTVCSQSSEDLLSSDGQGSYGGFVREAGCSREQNYCRSGSGVGVFVDGDDEELQEVVGACSLAG